MTYFSKTTLFLVLTLTFYAAHAAERTGSLIVPHSITNTTYSSWQAITKDNQNRILLGGNSRTSHGICKVSVSRLTATGELDATFGPHGTVYLPLSVGFKDNSCHAILIDAHNNILVIGSSCITRTKKKCFLIVRFTSEGLLDGSFGPNKNGIVHILSPFDTTSCECSSAVLDRNGAIILAGTLFQSKDEELSNFLIARVTSAGDLDHSFGRDGFNSIPNIQHESADMCDGIVINSKGNLILGGTSKDTLGHNCFAAAQLTPQGLLDTSFGTNGNGTMCYNTSGPGYEEVCHAITLDHNEHIVLAGNSFNTLFNSNFCVTRIIPEGTIDPSFGAGGTVCLPSLAAGLYDGCYSLAIDHLERIILGGSTNTSNGVDVIATVRLTHAGDVDTSFGDNGIFFMGCLINDVCHAIMTDAQGSVFIAGLSEDYQRNTNYIIGKVTSEGAIDTSFGKYDENHQPETALVLPEEIRRRQIQ